MLYVGNQRTVELRENILAQLHIWLVLNQTYLDIVQFIIVGLTTWFSTSQLDLFLQPTHPIMKRVFTSQQGARWNIEEKRNHLRHEWNSLGVELMSVTIRLRMHAWIDIVKASKANYYALRYLFT